MLALKCCQHCVHIVVNIISTSFDICCFCPEGNIPTMLRPIDRRALTLQQRAHHIPVQCLLSQMQSNAFTLDGFQCDTPLVWTRRQANQLQSDPPLTLYVTLTLATCNSCTRIYYH